jgi:hypothetical protein
MTPRFRNRDADLTALLDEEQRPPPELPPITDEPPPEPDASTEAPPAVATPEPQAASAPISSADEDDPLSALLSGYGGAQQPALDIPPPPVKEKPSQGPAILGTVLDVLLNKGRHVPQMIAQFGQPQDTDYENWRRQVDWQKARAGRGGGSANPYSLAIRAAELKARQKALALQGEGVGVRKAAQKTREEAQARDLDPQNTATVANRQWLYDHGAEQGSLDGFDGKAISQMKSLIEKHMTTREGSPLEQQDVTHAARKAGAQSHATVGDRIAVAEAGANIAEERERKQNADLSQITGWHRRSDAPELKPVESEGLRKTDAAAQQYQDALQRLRDANSKLGASDYAQATVNKSTPAMAAAIAAHSNVLTKQRVLENLGTPQAAELKMVNAQVPPPNSFGGAVNGDAAYGAMLNEYQQNHAAMMTKYGYERDEAPAGDAPASLGVTQGAGPRVDHVMQPHGKKKTAKQLAAEGWE